MSTELSRSLPKTAVVAGLIAGGVASLVDGSVAAYGIDSSLFLHQVHSFGWSESLRYVHPAWDGIGGLFQCLAATTFVYTGTLLAVALLAALVFGKFVKRAAPEKQLRLLAGIALGFWFAIDVFWCTRPVYFSGVSMLDPLRIVAVAGLGLVSFGAMVAATWFFPRVKLEVQRPLAVLVVVLFVSGAGVLLADRMQSSQRGAINERNKDLPNVVIFIVDALRQDVIGAYGAERVKTPHIDSIAERGVLFEESFVQAPFTWSSFGSMLTGKYPRRHGLIRMKPGIRMAPNITLPYHLKGAKKISGEQLEETDYVSTAFLTGTLSQGSGLLRGFDVYFEAMVGHELVDIHSQWSRFRVALLPFLIKNKLTQKVNNRLVASTAVDWFRENAAEKRFMSLVHFYSTHTPYDPADEFKEMYVDPNYDGPISAFYAEYREMIERGEYDATPEDEQQIRDLYYGGVSMADAMIGSVLAEIEAQGVLDNTIVIITSDHGEELGEHNLWEHNWMYQTNLRIPFIMSWPKGLPQGQRVDEIVDTIDFLPTLCDLMELQLPVDEDLPPDRAKIDGTSLVPLIEGEVARVREYTIAENNFFRSIQNSEFKLIVRFKGLEDGAWEKIVAGELEEPRLFDLTKDADETLNAFHVEREEAHKLWLALKEWSDSMPIGDHFLTLSDRDRENELVMRTNLEKLGYAGGVDFDDENDELEDEPVKKD